MSAFFLLVMLVGWAISWYMQTPGILWIAVAFALVMNISAYWFSDKIALSSTGAKEADPVKFLELHRILENLAITAGLPKPRLYIIEDNAPNAFAAGRDPKHAVVAVTTGLLAQLDRSELEGVLAHELSHVGNRDILVMTVAVVLAGLITVVVDMFLRVSLFGGGGNRDRGGKRNSCDSGDSRFNPRSDCRAINTACDITQAGIFSRRLRRAPYSLSGGSCIRVAKNFFVSSADAKSQPRDRASFHF